MSISRVSVVLPVQRPADLPADIRGESAAELLAAWTALWHPALLAETGVLPGWHSADQPPELDDLSGELVVVPGVSRMKLPQGWCDQLRATAPRNPPPVEASADRAQMVDDVLRAAGLDASAVDADVVGAFLALGYAQLQVELVTRAMQYSSVLDSEAFEPTVIAAARAGVAGDASAATDGVGRALDLLADARRHYYPVDFYLVDVTLLAETTLGEPLRAKLATGTPTSLLASGELVERLARHHPETLHALRTAIAADTACVVGGLDRDTADRGGSPEALLAALNTGGEAYRRWLGREAQVFARYHTSTAPLLPETLAGIGIGAALCASFDGTRVPLAEQTKMRWEGPSGTSVDALSAVPCDIAQPGTWLALGERIGDSLLRDHVATVLLAGWPGNCCEYFGDLRRLAQFGAVLGKLVTLEEYFAVTREAVDWSTFRSTDLTAGAVLSGERIASSVATYRRDVTAVHGQLLEGLCALLPPGAFDQPNGNAAWAEVVVNPWSCAGPRYVGFSPLGLAPAGEPAAGEVEFVPEVPGCGYRVVSGDGERSEQARHPHPQPLSQKERGAGHPHPNPLPKGEGTKAKGEGGVVADGRTLRNEQVEVVIGESTGGIQSLRAFGDRGTRVSQRLVVRDPRRPLRAEAALEDPSAAEVRMVADRVEVTRSDAVVGEVTSHGRLVAADGYELARFVQTVRLLRGASVVVVDVALDELDLPDGPAYVGSRLAWRDEAAELRHGVGWIGRPAGRRRIESPEWVEVAGSQGLITLFALGLPVHERIGPRMLDTPLAMANEQQGRYQFAVGLDCEYPTATALWLRTPGSDVERRSLAAPAGAEGWFLHVGARNVLMTHIEPLTGGRDGLRMRLLETEGRRADATLSAYRPLHTARHTDFRGEPTSQLSVVDGEVRLLIRPYQWMQVEAEW